MSKVIKAGNCSFYPLNGLERGCADTGDEDQCFNRLSALIDLTSDSNAQDPDKTNDSPSSGRVPNPDGSPAECESRPDQTAKTRREAEQVLREAKAEAEALKSQAQQILKDARQKSAEIESEAYAQGFEQGKKDGEELGRRQYEATAQRLNEVIESIQTQGGQLLSKYEAQMVQLTLEVARQIVHQEIEIDPQIVVRCVKAAMDLIVEGSHLCIHLNPKDVELVGEEIQVDLSAPGRHPVEIKPDAKIERGGCLLETEFGLVDATLGARWQSVVHTIRQILNERTGHGLKLDE